MLLRAIADLDPNLGEIKLGDHQREELSAPDWRKLAGYLPAEAFWWDDLVSAHFQFDASEQVTSLGLPANILDRQIYRLSTGERQRLALIRLLQNKPALLLLDEPTASLDPASVEKSEALINQYRQEQGASVIWVSHDQQQLARIAHSKMRIEEGMVLMKDQA